MVYLIVGLKLVSSSVMGRVLQVLPKGRMGHNLVLSTWVSRITQYHKFIDHEQVVLIISYVHQLNLIEIDLVNFLSNILGEKLCIFIT